MGGCAGSAAFQVLLSDDRVWDCAFIMLSDDGAMNRMGTGSPSNTKVV
jgi:hypothetical protein